MGAQVYRLPLPASDEATLWYGPWPLRIGPALGALGLAVGILLLGSSEERQHLHSIRCSRPGICQVRRGTSLVGVTEAERFDASSIVRAELARTKSKSPVTQLRLLDRQGESRVLAEGLAATQLLPKVQPFFDDTSPSTLALTNEHTPVLRGALALVVAIALGVAAALLVRAARRSGTFRITIESGHLHVARMRFGRPVGERSVPLALISSLELQSGPRADARIMLHTSEGPDFPITDRPLPASAQHAELVEALRDRLRLGPSGAAGAS